MPIEDEFVGEFESQALFTGGSKLFMYDVNDSNPVEVAELVELPLSFKRDVLDATSHSTGGWKARKAGLKDIGDLQCDILFNKDDATHMGFLDMLMDENPNPKARIYKLVYPGNPALIVAFRALCTGVSLPNKTDDILRAQVTLSSTGKPVIDVADPETV